MALLITRLQCLFGCSTGGFFASKGGNGHIGLTIVPMFTPYQNIVGQAMLPIEVPRHAFPPSVQARGRIGCQIPYEWGGGGVHKIPAAVGGFKAHAARNVPHCHLHRNSYELIVFRNNSQFVVIVT